MADDESIRLMAQKGTFLVPTIIASRSVLDNPHLPFPEYVLRKSRIAAARHKEVVAAALHEGVKFAFGTDAGSTGNEHGEQAGNSAIWWNTASLPCRRCAVPPSTRRNCCA